MSAKTPTGKDGLSAPDVCSIAHVTPMEIRWWQKERLVGPSLARAKGRGTVARFSGWDLAEVVIAKRLRDAGLSLLLVRRALELVRPRRAEVMEADLVLVTDGNALCEIVPTDQVDGLLAGARDPNTLEWRRVVVKITIIARSAQSYYEGVVAGREATRQAREQAAENARVAAAARRDGFLGEVAAVAEARARSEGRAEVNIRDLAEALAKRAPAAPTTPRRQRPTRRARRSPTRRRAGRRRAGRRRAADPLPPRRRRGGRRS